jgi:hypothetical protein
MLLFVLIVIDAAKVVPIIGSANKIMAPKINFERFDPKGLFFRLGFGSRFNLGIFTLLEKSIPVV